MPRGRFRIALISAVFLAAAAGALWLSTGDGHFPGRYGEIRGRIVDNLHFSAHFTWAVNTETIRAVRPHVGEADVGTLARMLADERASVAIAAAHLLELLGKPGEAALRAAAKDGNAKVRLYAETALQHLAQCRNPAVRNLDRTVCPAEANAVRPDPRR